MKEVFIYGLIDPRTNKIRYIGKTVQKLKQRLKGHLSVNKNDFTYRANWIRKLKSLNLKPEIILIETCNTDNWCEREIYWISEYNKTHDLTNTTKGGNGGHIVKDTTKNKLSQKLVERWEDSEYREKMCTMSKNTWKNPSLKKERSEKYKKLWEDPEYREKMCKISKEKWQDPTFRDKIVNNKIRSEKLSKARSGTKLSNKTKKKIGDKSKELWKLNHDKWSKAKPKIPVIINGIEYESMAVAAKALNFNPATISRYVKSDKHPNYIRKPLN